MNGAVAGLGGDDNSLVGALFTLCSVQLIKWPTHVPASGHVPSPQRQYLMSEQEKLLCRDPFRLSPHFQTLQP